MASGVRLGEWNQATNPDCDDDHCADPILDVPVTEYFPHENYGQFTQENDIALLRMSRSVEFTNYIMPICLPVSSQTRNTNNNQFIVAGWGRVSLQFISLFQLFVFYFLKMEINSSIFSSLFQSCFRLR